MIKKVQVVSFLDISKKPPDLNEAQKRDNSRIMATEDDEENEQEEEQQQHSSKRLLKLILRDETGKLIIAVEHEPESIPLRIQEGTWMLLDDSRIKVMQSVAFLRKGALY